VAFPGESAEYRAARDRLLAREVELRRAMEAVAAARRELPPGGVVPEDYVFQGRAATGTPTGVRLSELFAAGKDSLVVYNFMFPRDPRDDRPGPKAGETALLPLAEAPCPSCVALLDQLDGAVQHATQQINFVVVAKAPLPRLLTFAPMDPGQDHRSVGTLEPLWNLFDVTRQGRPADWDEQLSYP